MWKHNLLFKLQVQHREQPTQAASCSGIQRFVPLKASAAHHDFQHSRRDGSGHLDHHTDTSDLALSAGAKHHVDCAWQSVSKSIFFQFRVYSGGRGAELAEYGGGLPGNSGEELRKLADRSCRGTLTMWKKPEDFFLCPKGLCFWGVERQNLAQVLPKCLN